MALVSAPPQPISADRIADPGQEQQEEEEQQQQQQSCSNPSGNTSNGLLSVRFNQDYGCFACGTDGGFRIYNCEPFKETFRREFSNGGIGIVEMLFRCNILAIVGGGSNPRYPPNKVMIWDDHQSRCIGELSFRSEVRAVRLRRDRIVVVLEHKIYVYNFSDLKLLNQIETIANPKGLCALSPASNALVLACPGLNKGQVRVEQYALRKTKFIPAHDSHLACLALTFDGRLLATASTKGTLVRIHSTMDGTQLQEVRRGTERAEIYSIAFSSNAQFLAVSSDKGTIHVFSLKVPGSMEEARSGENNNNNNTIIRTASGVSSPVGSPAGNPGSTLSFMRGVLPRYFSSEWSFAQFRLPEDSYCIVAFGAQKNTVLIVSTEGSFFRCSFDPVQGGEMVQQEFSKFTKVEESI